MSHSSLVRLGAIAALLSGALTAVFNLAAIVGLNTPGFDNPRAMAALSLSVFAYMVIYSRQAGQAGRLGLLGFVLLTLALMFNVAFRYVSTFIVPTLSTYTEAATAVFSGAINTFIFGVFGLYLLGYVLFGIATVRAKVFPVWTGWMLVVGSILNFATGMSFPAVAQFGVALTAIALMWMGYVLWTGREEQASPVAAQPAV